MHITPTRISINGITVTGVLCVRSNTYVRLDCFGEGIICCDVHPIRTYQTNPIQSHSDERRVFTRLVQESVFYIKTIVTLG